MAFSATQRSLQRAFEQLQQAAESQKVYLDTWAAKLQGDITALDAIELVASIRRHLRAIDDAAATPGLREYVKAQFNSSAYDAVAEVASMRAALVAVRDWLINNLPANSVTVKNGALSGVTLDPTATAPLRALVVAAAATIA